MRGLSIVALVSLLCWSYPAVAQVVPDDLAARLREGGLVVYFRHGVTRGDGGSVSRLEGCEDERNLTGVGRDAMRQVQAAVEAIKPTISEVLPSPFCRTRETAMIAFGKVQATEVLTSTFGEVRDEKRLQETLRLLSTPPEPGTLRIMVSHGSNLTDTLGITLDEGEAAILDPQDNGAGQHELIARLLQSQWSDVAQSDGRE
jgi:phosphohistidine phosphatase SixA